MQRTADFRARNPSMLLPVFVTEDGVALSQSIPIIECACRRHAFVSVARVARITNKNTNFLYAFIAFVDAQIWISTILTRRVCCRRTR